MQLEQARLLRKVAGLDAALGLLRQLSARHPGNPELLAAMADWLFQAGDVEAALEVARTALAAEETLLAPETRSGLHYLLGLHMRRSGQLDQAVHHLDEATRHNPNALDAYLNLGQVLQERRQHEQALFAYQRAIQVAENDYRPYFYAGQVLKNRKEYLEADKMLRRAAKLAPSEVSVHRLLAAVVALNLVHNR